MPHKNPNGIKGSHTTLKAHPTRHDWVLARAKRPGCRLLDEVEMRCANDLLIAEVSTQHHSPQMSPSCTLLFVGPRLSFCALLVLLPLPLDCLGPRSLCPQ